MPLFMFYFVVRFLHPILPNLPEQLIRPLNFLMIILPLTQAYLNLNTTKMKRKFFIALFALAAMVTITSCSAQNGCKGTQGMVGYGHR